MSSVGTSSRLESSSNNQASFYPNMVSCEDHLGVATAPRNAEMNNSGYDNMQDSSMQFNNRSGSF